MVAILFIMDDKSQPGLTLRPHLPGRNQNRIWIISPYCNLYFFKVLPPFEPKDQKFFLIHIAGQSFSADFPLI